MNVIGAAGRLLGGRLSDRLRQPGGPIRRIALATAAVLGRGGRPAVRAGWLFVPALVVGGGLSMSWNGLSVAAAVESAGPGGAAPRSGSSRR